MRKRAIKKQLRLEMEQEYSRLSVYEKKQEESLTSERACTFMSRNIGRGIAFAAIAGIILFSGIVGLKKNRTCTIVSMDVNPAFEIALNEKEQVVTIDAKNEDAKQVLGDMELEKVDAEVAMNALIGSMYQQGYLDAQSSENVVLLTVDNKDPKKAKEIEEKLSQSIQNSAQQSDSQIMVLSQQNAPTEEDKAFAEQYQISWGRAMLIHRLVEQYPDLSKEELAGMTIREMTTYLNENQIDYRAFVDCDDDDLDDIDDDDDLDEDDDADDMDDTDDTDDEDDDADDMDDTDDTDDDGDDLDDVDDADDDADDSDDTDDDDGDDVDNLDDNEEEDDDLEEEDD